MLLSHTNCDEIFPGPSGPSDFGWIPVYIPDDSAFHLRMADRRTNRIRSLHFYDPLDTSHSVTLGAYRYRLDSLKGIGIYDTIGGLANSVNKAYFIVPGIRSIEVENNLLLVNNIDDDVLLEADSTATLTISARGIGRATPFEFPNQ